MPVPSFVFPSLVFSHIAEQPVIGWLILCYLMCFINMVKDHTFINFNIINELIGYD